MKHSWRVLTAILLAATLISAGATQSSADDPAFLVEVVEDGLDIPWDITFLPNGSMLYTERSKKLIHLRTPGEDGVDTVIVDAEAAADAGVWSTGETGMMGIEVAADFATTRAFLTCHGYKDGDTQDVRVVRWKLNPAHTAATPARTIVKGLPSRTGRHAGCALVKGGQNSLYIGTGDAGTGTYPQKKYSGGGKVLRVDATTGKGMVGNPFQTSDNYFAQRIWTYGHRNVQGLARRSDGSTWSNEHGSSVDDEINLLQKGGNYGWNPRATSAHPAQYNEDPGDSPMTDFSIPGTQIRARWDSGNPTFATSGITFVNGTEWGDLNGALAVAALKDRALRFFVFDSKGKLKRGVRPAVLDHSSHGRLRAAVQGPDGNLYLSTSNSTGESPGIDKILKVTPVF